MRKRLAQTSNTKLVNQLAERQPFPGTQIVEHGRKTDEEKKRGESREGKGEGYLALAPVYPCLLPRFSLGQFNCLIGT